MIKIRVNLKEKEKHYNIFVGKKLLEKINEYIPEINEKKRIAIITDSNLKELYGNKLLETIHEFNEKSMLFSFPAGEKNKNRRTKEELENQLLVAGFDRESVILALGGGVTGDLAGFIASTYYRGIPFYQIPTTIIAMTDSSIGGKTGVDTVYGKNLIGSFYQPDGVISDIDTLETLPDLEYFQGMAEVIKYGIIDDRDFFFFIKKNLQKIINRDFKTLEEIISRSADNKRRIVEEDEKEKGLRKILNFGHTIGHGIEVINDYKIPHGIAVAYGMIIESIMLVKADKLSNDELSEISELIVNLPLNIEHKCPSLDSKKLMNAVKYDKKRSKGRIPNILIYSIGECDREKLTMDIDYPLLENSIKYFLDNFFTDIKCKK